MQATTGMRTGTPRDEGHDCIVEIDGENTVITQRFIRSYTERIDGMDDTMTLPKFQKNSADRRETNPTITNDVKLLRFIT